MCVLHDLHMTVYQVLAYYVQSSTAGIRDGRETIDIWVKICNSRSADRSCGTLDVNRLSRYPTSGVLLGQALH